MATMTASDLIDMSIRENRAITEYPETQEEFAELEEALCAECDDSNDVSGKGFSGPESRGCIDFWGRRDEDGDTWRVNLIRPRDH